VRTFGAVLLLLGLVPGVAREARPDDATAGVTAVPVEGAPVSGALVALGPDGAVVQPPERDAPPRRVAPEDLRALHWPRAPAGEAARDRWRFTLVGGERAFGALRAAGAESLRFETLADADVVVPFDALLTLEFFPARAEGCLDPAGRHRREGEGDLAYDARGDQIRGTVASASETGLTMQMDGGRERLVPWEALRVLHLDNPCPGPGEGVFTEVETLDGSRWIGAGLPRLEGGRLRFAARSLPALTLAIPLERARAARTEGPRFAYATRLPHRERHEGFYASPHPEDIQVWMAAGVDQRPSGCPLRLGGVVHRHGFGVHAASRIEVTLDGAFRRFEALCGIDDEALAAASGERREKGLVDARVIGDGKVLWEARGVAEGEAPRRVGPVDVRGVKTLVLEVDPGDHPTMDRADWADPVLLR